MTTHTILPKNFLDWMNECTMHIVHHSKPFDNYIFKINRPMTDDWSQFPFDKKQMYDYFIECHPSMKKKVSAKRLYSWMRIFALGYDYQPIEWRSNCHGYIQFNQSLPH